MNKFPDKVIVLMNKPHHIDTVNKMEETDRMLETQRLFAEWMLIGQGEELIANEAHDFGVSSFSRLSWLYQLKEDYFSLKTLNLTSAISDDIPSQCVRKKFHYVGNLFMLPNECKAT